MTEIDARRDAFSLWRTVNKCEVSSPLSPPRPKQANLKLSQVHSAENVRKRMSPFRASERCKGELVSEGNGFLLLPPPCLKSGRGVPLHLSPQLSKPRLP